MKKTLCIGIGLSSLLLPGTAIAQDACGTSYMVLPDGSCMNMQYLTILGQSRRNQAQAEAAYTSQFQANLNLDTNTFYRAAESDSEREARLESLAESGLSLEDIRQSVNSVESSLFPIQTEAMTCISQVYQPQFSR